MLPHLTVLNSLLEHTQSAEYKKAVERTEKQAQDHRRLSKRIWDANWWLAKGKEVSMKAQQGQFWNLKKWEKKLVAEYDSGELDVALKKLLDQHTSIYNGMGA